MTLNRTHQRRFSAKSHVGLVRKVNEDAMLSQPELGLWAVADGMGGHHGGDFASQTVIDALAALPTDLPPQDLPTRIRGALNAAHDAIRAEAVQQGNITIGTTAVVLALAEEHFLCLWTGDSRLYRMQAGQLEMVSLDHSVVGEMVEAGQLSWDEAEHHVKSNQITRAVGVGEVLEIDKRRGAVAPGDRFLLCSDGLTKYTTQAALADIMRNTPIEDLAEELMHVALAGGAEDNVSVIAIEA